MFWPLGAAGAGTPVQATFYGELIGGSGHTLYVREGDQFGALVSTTNLVVLLGCLWLLWLGRRQANEEERRLNLLEAYTVGACRNPRSTRQTGWTRNLAVQ